MSDFGNKRLLEMRELSMIEISDRVGFSSYSQFTTFFRKYTGITPKAYRKALN
jgi:AraC-like DNA-binding protein